MQFSIQKENCVEANRYRIRSSDPRVLTITIACKYMANGRLQAGRSAVWYWKSSSRIRFLEVRSELSLRECKSMHTAPRLQGDCTERGSGPEMGEEYPEVAPDKEGAGAEFGGACT
jgi:hypothetical protein